MTSLISTLFVNAVRLLVLAAFTFAFVVLLEHGTKDFVEGATIEWRLLTNEKTDDSSTAQPRPSPVKKIWSLIKGTPKL